MMVARTTLFFSFAAFLSGLGVCRNKHLYATLQDIHRQPETVFEDLAAVAAILDIAEEESPPPPTITTTTTTPYAPASSEQFVLDHADEFGLNLEKGAMGCQLYPFFLDGYNRTAQPPASRIQKIVLHSLDRGLDPSRAFAKSVHNDLKAYDVNLDRHIAAVRDFVPIPDLMESIHYDLDKKTGDDNSNGNGINTLSVNHDVCATARLHPDGLAGLFPDTTTSAAQTKTQTQTQTMPTTTTTQQLSHTSTSGYVEPLLPPMRSHKYCDPRQTSQKLMALDYLVHDFEHMCRKLKPTSRRVFIDMGASLAFHTGGSVPVVELLQLYEKFGFAFDHIYGFEVTFQQPSDVFGTLLPEKYLASYHWINVGVDATEGHRLNPLHSILKQFNEDDFVVVKLDIDTPSIEHPLVYQLLNDPTYHHLIDQFYFEHHVNLEELKLNWYPMVGTVKESLALFHGLREKGIPAHFWP